jgi:alkylation response protein AidB-like acyl-CoA dehydrogenase
MFVEAIADILKDRFVPQALRKIEQGVEVREAWRAVEEAGFLELLAPEEAGGAGLALGELYPILLEVGKHAVPLPIGQTIAARAILSKSGAGRPRA